MNKLRRIRNVACGIAFLFFIIPLGALYKLEEGLNLSKRRRKKLNSSNEPFKSKSFRTVYPDDFPKDFNSWAEHIYREQNKN